MTSFSKGVENLWQAFDETACRVPERDAIVQGDGHTSFRGLRRRAEDYRVRLEDCGIEPGQRVLLWIDASAEEDLIAVRVRVADSEAPRA
jgi:non-ribosomal peptide synthetase component E (peptide arylation enzyme)